MIKKITGKSVWFLFGLLLPVSIFSNAVLFNNAAAQELRQLPELQKLPFDFNMDDVFHSEEDPAFNPFEGAALERVENPFKSGLNESDFVLQYEKTAGSLPWAGFFYHLEEPFYISDESEFRLRVWSPRENIEAVLMLEIDGYNEQSDEMHADITQAGEWTDLVWDLSDQYHQTPWDMVVIIMDLDIGHEVEGGTDHTWYLDDFRFAGEHADNGNGDNGDDGNGDNGDDGNGVETDEFTVYFSNPENWPEVYLYAWEMEDDQMIEEMAMWPGELTEKHYFDDGSEWWGYTLSDQFNYVIFNDGAMNQTGDLERNTTGWFDGDEWHDTRPGAQDDPDDPGPYITIAEARELPYGSEVTIRGIITKAYGDFSRIQDDTGALVIRQPEGLWNAMVADGSLTEGDLVQLTGLTSEFASLEQINEEDLLDFEILSSNNPMPEPYHTDLTGISENGYELQSQLVRVENITLHTMDQELNESTTYLISDQTLDEGVVNLRISHAHDQPIAGTPIDDDVYHFEGVVSQFSHSDPHAGFQLLPVYPGDFVPAWTDTVPPPLNEVTFLVDMSAAGDFNPDSHDVYITGEMFDWEMPGTDPDARLAYMGNETYSITLHLDSGTYDYKYFLVEDEPTWEFGEWTDGTPDRQLFVTDDMEVMDTFGHLTDPDPDPETDEYISILATDVNGNVITLTMGLDPDATGEYRDGIDQYAPPLWPGVFDARILYENESFITLVLPPTVDLTVWNLSFQLPPEGFPIELSWDPGQLLSEGTTTLRDQDGNVILNMADTGQWMIEEQEHLDLQVVNALSVDREVTWYNHWNLLGLPLHADDNHYQALFPGSLSNTLYTFDGAYTLREYLEPGTGYWIRFPESGSAMLSGMAVEQLELNLQAGWNMISGPSHTVDEGMIEDNEGILLTGTLYGFDGAYVQVSTIEPGSGYWIRADAPGTILLGSAGSAAPGKQLAQAEEPDLTGFDRLIVSNEEGHTRTLYFGDILDKSVPEIAFTLPPIPPHGAFDARFSGDRILVSEDGGLIELASRSGITLALELADPSADLYYRFAIPEQNEAAAVLELQHGESQTIDLPAKTLTLQMSGQSGPPDADLPEKYELAANYPNPFNPATTIRYSLPEQGMVHLAVYNLLGQKVATLINEERPAGHHEVIFDATGFSSGVYIYRMQAGHFSTTKKMMLVK